jgi:hypothetical protein
MTISTSAKPAPPARPAIHTIRRDEAVFASPECDGEAARVAFGAANAAASEYSGERFH